MYSLVGALTNCLCFAAAVIRKLVLCRQAMADILWVPFVDAAP